MAHRGIALVTGAGGFIGHHLASTLVGKGWYVRGADLKHPEFEKSEAHEFSVCDLRLIDDCMRVCKDIDHVYHLAADMGGIGYITSSHADIAINNVLINAHILVAAQRQRVQRFLFSSSACVYPQHLQRNADVTPLKEDDAFPADPEEGYGLEKLFMEKLCQYVTEDYGMPTRVVRFHNVYGPLGTYDGGREKAPAAICRKVAACREGDEIEIWGDGKQTRSFMYIEDCIEGIVRLMESEYAKPLNLGTEELVTIDELVDTVAQIAGKRVVKRYDPSRPQGVRGRNSDNTLLRQVLGWEPKVTLRQGCVPTYRWIAEQIAVERTEATRQAAD